MFLSFLPIFCIASEMVFLIFCLNLKKLHNFFKGHPSLDLKFSSAVTASRANLTPPHRINLKPPLMLECGAVVMVEPMPASSFVFSAPVFYVSPFSLTLQWSCHLPWPWDFPSSAPCSLPFHCHKTDDWASLSDFTALA